MTIELYVNNSEAIVVDKNITPLRTVSGTLRTPSSILSPVILIDGDVEIAKANYLWISEFERFYFVGDIVSTVNGLWELSCHVDVLSTYKNKLRTLSAILARQENVYNLYLEDDRLLTTCRRIYWTKAFPVRPNPGNSIDGSSFILTVAGGAESSS